MPLSWRKRPHPVSVISWRPRGRDRWRRRTFSSGASVPWRRERGRTRPRIQAGCHDGWPVDDGVGGLRSFPAAPLGFVCAVMCRLFSQFQKRGSRRKLAEILALVRSLQSVDDVFGRQASGEIMRAFLRNSRSLSDLLQESRREVQRTSSRQFKAFVIFH